MKRILPLIAFVLPVTAFAHTSPHAHEHLSVALLVGVTLAAIATVYYVRHKK